MVFGMRLKGSEVASGKSEYRAKLTVRGVSGNWWGALVMAESRSSLKPRQNSWSRIIFTARLEQRPSYATLQASCASKVVRTYEADYHFTCKDSR